MHEQKNLTQEKYCMVIKKSYSYSGCTNQQVFISLHGGLEQFALDAVQRFKPLKCSLGVLWHLLNSHKSLKIKDTKKFRIEFATTSKVVCERI